MEINDNQLDTDIVVDELTLLKQRATVLGIKFSPNIGVDKLREKVNSIIQAKEEEKTSTDPLVVRKRVRNEAMKLIRCRIQNLDPKKSKLPGEIITVANPYIGTVRKFVPFGEATDNGYHIPNCIYQFIKNRKFQNIRVTKNAKGEQVVHTSMVPEFAIEVLPPLTQKELQDLAKAQLAAGSIG